MRHARSATLNLMALASALMIGGLLLLLLGITGAYFFDHRLTMAGIVAAHSLVILGPTAVKIGYVMLLAERQERLASYSTQHI